ncbi:gliding motility-associated C-terminal domain-containing protein [Flavihumibacter rivuli]|uniref:gliding motility-associated C-terminal domain-containing protein n=1 Tax=Flavihumibacter rivuli TaxID=2838156 RepID=UPI001BDDEC45|nr:gliding motility-associated C-terminal domain-containing protein [Flavihumibacter rivuli]ULQ55083.1 gliding motility-associated C-terminal domain-containing protein [Flavihumibacter rivuli]
MNRIFSYWLIILTIFVFTLPSKAQRIFINSNDSLYEVNISQGLCSTTKVQGICSQLYEEKLYSIALHKDTLYVITGNNNNVYRLNVNEPGNCVYVGRFIDRYQLGTSVNAFTADKNGILYGISGLTSELLRLDPKTGVSTNLGRLPGLSQPGGDLIFFKDKLYLTTYYETILEIDIEQLQNSKVFLDLKGTRAFGLISFPSTCTSNRYFAINSDSELVELDLENKKILDTICKYNFRVYDGASSVESGNTLGVTIDSILLTVPCNDPVTRTGSVRVVAGTASSGNLNYTINGITNTTGIFNGLPLGNYTIKVSNDKGCSTDSSFSLTTGISPDIRLAINHPLNCQVTDGSIAVNAQSNYLPLQYAYNGSAFSTVNTIKDLDSGKVAISIRDASGCQVDTSVSLSYREKPAFLQSISSTPSQCLSTNGSITLTIAPGTTNYKVSLNGSTPEARNFFNNLAEGSYAISITDAKGCAIDTSWVVTNIKDPQPQWQVEVTDEHCKENNGSVTVTINDPANTYQYSLNNGTFSSVNRFASLAPGTYPLEVRNQNSCVWDTAITIRPYELEPVNLTINKTDATCNEPSKGSLQFSVDGTAGPYNIRVNSRNYPNNGSLNNLSLGNYLLEVFDNKGCLVEDSTVVINLLELPECDNLYLPNAFTPNNDGKNDTYKAKGNPFIRDFNLSIYNRYGQLVFSSNSIQQAWDGRLAGQGQPSGTYVVNVQYTNYKGEKKKHRSTLTLIR